MKLSLSRLRRCLSALVAALLLTSSTLSGVSAAAGAGSLSTSAAATGASPPEASSSASPTVVAEVVASRTADSSTFQLSDGSRRAEIYSEPIHYRDRAGRWADIDPTLVPTGVFGQARANATELAETFDSSTTSGPPVTVAGADWSMGLDLLGGHEANLVALGDEAIYPLAQTDTQLTYESRRDGVKDTLVLGSPAAPDTFSFFVSLKNLAVYAEPGTGAYALFDQGSGKQAGRIEPLSVFDSRDATAGGPSVCASATMKVVPAAGGAYLTYHMPRAWLSDPARVYPVYVDPAVTFAGPSETRNDTFVAKGDAAYHYADNHLDASTFATGDVRRALVNFNLTSLPNGSAINSAVLQMYLWQNSSGGNFTTLCQPIVGSWGYNATWANSFGNGSIAVGTGGDYQSIPAGANQYVAWNMTKAVQNWFNGAMANNGLVLYANSETAVCQHSFWSAEYTTWTSRQPHLIVDYTPPSLTVDSINSSYHAGDKVALTVHAKSRAVTNLQAKVDGLTASGATTTQAQFAFTTAAPGAGWVSTPVSGGYLAYSKTAAVLATPDAGIEPDLSACSATTRTDGRDVTFVYRIGAGHGDVQNNRVSVIDTDWQGAWQDSGQVYSVQTSMALPPRAVTSASASWFAEADKNGDGQNDSGCDTDTAGRGAVTLSWPTAPAAAGYAVYLFDGYQYDRIATTTTTYWATAGRRLYPSDSAIASMAAGFTGNPFRIDGLDLRDDPRPLYAKTAGTVWDTMPSYAFKVVPYNSAGSAPISECGTVTVELDGRTKHVLDAPRHTEVDLGSLLGDEASIRLDCRDLVLSTTDLDLPGAGPDVSVGRVYRSSVTSEGILAPGWRFGFERSVLASGNVATYFDEYGDAHVFAKSDGRWLAGHGETSILTGDAASGFTLVAKDRMHTVFDARGRLASATDGNGNCVHYEWAADGSTLVIRAPKDVPVLHERRVTVSLSDGRVTRASAHAGSGDADRVVTYCAQSNALTVTKFPGTGAQQSTIYRYDSTRRLSALAVPGFAPSVAGEAVWSMSYDTSGTSLTVANGTGGGTPSASRTVTWDVPTGRATITSASGTSTVTFDPLGQQTSATAENTTAATLDAYDVDGNSIREISPTGRTSRSLFDGRGNPTAQTEENGATTTFAYSADLCVGEADARGARTIRVFDSETGNLLLVEKTLNDVGDLSHVEYAYNADGTLANEKTRVDASRTAETDYSDYSDSGDAQTVLQRNVELAEGSPRDLVSHTWVDGFGGALSEVDALGATTISRQFDSAGRELEATDASGTVTHTRYGVLGEVAKTWRSNPTTTTLVDWDEVTVDGIGNVATETAKASDGSVVSTVVHVYDAAGREVKSDDSLVPGTSVQNYDPQGNVRQSWEEGSDASSATASVRSAFNAEGEETSSTAPGATTASTTTSMTAEGDVAEQTEPDGASTELSYDEAGDLVGVAEATDEGVADTSLDNDLDGRTTDVVDADGNDESVEFDLAGNEIASTLGTHVATTKVVNVLGWTLRNSDFDGVVTSYSYDPLGRVVRADVAGAITTTDYDASGRACRQCNPDGSNVVWTYDCFGRPTGSVDSSGAIVRRAENTTYDASGRDGGESVTTPLGSSSITSVRYNDDGEISTTRVGRSGDASVTTNVDGAGKLRLLVSRASGIPIDLSVTATDSAGRVIATASSALPIVRTYAYTQAGQLSRSVLGSATLDYVYSPVSGRKLSDGLHSASGSCDESSDYTYDLGGRLVCANTNGTATHYEYDSVSGALVGVKRGQAATTTVSYETSGTGRLIAAGGRIFRSDSAGHRVASGSAACPTETTLVWSGDRLAKFSAPSRVATYDYDASGRRTRSLVESAGVSTATDFDYDEDRLAGVSAARSDGATWTIDYLYDGEGRLFAGVYAACDASPTPFLAVTTDRGDVRELLDVNGIAFASYSYDAYGVGTEPKSAGTQRVPAAVAAQIATRQTLRYASYVLDTESGLYYCSARYYDPSVAAFISKDPARADGEESPYQYCAGDPIGKTDPSGEMFISIRNRDKFDLVRRRLVAAAKKLVKWNVRYSHGAHVQKPRNNGQMDCSGAVAWVFRKAGTWFRKHIPDPTSGSRWNTDSFIHHLTWKHRKPSWSRKRFAPGRRWQIGDVLVKGWSGGRMGHIVMVIRDGGSPKLFECAGSAPHGYHEGARFISWHDRLAGWRPVWAGRFFDYEPQMPYGGRI